MLDLNKTNLVYIFKKKQNKFDSKLLKLKIQNAHLKHYYPIWNNLMHVVKNVKHKLHLIKNYYPNELHYRDTLLQ